MHSPLENLFRGSVIPKLLSYVIE